MEIAPSVADLRRFIAFWRKEDERVGLVPTMGALHQGHMALVRAARAECDRVVTSIFVNPKQFAPTEDLGSYPHREAADLGGRGHIGGHPGGGLTLQSGCPAGSASQNMILSK